MVSEISSKFSSFDIFKAFFTWKSHVFPTIVITSVSAFKSDCTLASLSQLLLALLVLPNAVSFEFINLSFLIFLKKASSLSLDPGHPPSIYFIPSSSILRATLILSSTENETPSPCVPSLNVTSYASILFMIILIQTLYEGKILLFCMNFY